MSNTSDNKDFGDREDMQDIMKLRRARQLAVAILKRSRDAGIPEKYMRLNQQVFASVLDPDFHGGKVRGINAFATSVYKEPDFLLKRDFIAIDGGNFESRQVAGFAVLFRLIAYDKIGQCVNCDSLIHKFQTINSTSEITRNDLAEEVKSYDVLFINEFDKLRFSPHFETGSFFDEVLAERINMERPTIVTFVNPIIADAGDCDSGCGRHLARLGLIPQTTKSVLRIRVKNL